jgi:hypothetical protein
MRADKMKLVFAGQDDETILDENSSSCQRENAVRWRGTKYGTGSSSRRYG